MNNQNEIETKRLFIAVHVPEILSKNIINQTKYLDNNIWKKTEEKNLHITLLWLGDVPTFVIEQVKEILENVVSRTKPFSLKNGKVLVMLPNNPYMLWIKFDKNKWFEDIILDLEKCFWKIGNWKEGRDRKMRKQSGEKVVIPHITIARTRNRDLLDSLYSPIETSRELSEIKCNQISLIESRLNSEINEVKYQIIETYSL